MNFSNGRLMLFAVFAFTALEVYAHEVITKNATGFPIILTVRQRACNDFVVPIAVGETKTFHTQGFWGDACCLLSIEVQGSKYRSTYVPPSTGGDMRCAKTAFTVRLKDWEQREIMKRSFPGQLIEKTYDVFTDGLTFTEGIQ